MQYNHNNNQQLI